MLINYRSKNGLFNFTVDEPSECGQNNKFTVIVGKNGTGKSRLLRAVINNLLNDKTNLQRFAREEGLRDYNFEPGELFTFKEPKKIIAVSTSPFDKFPFTDRGESIEGYCYLGLRGLHSYNLGVAYMSRIMGSLIKSVLIEVDKAQSISNVLDYLGYSDRIQARFHLSIPVSRFKRVINSTNIFEEFESLMLGISPRAIDRNYFNDNNGKLNKEIVNRTINIFRDITEANIYKPRFDIQLDRDGVRILNSFYHLDDDFLFLLQSGILKLRELTLEKRDHSAQFRISDASSGEQSVVMGLLGIASQIENDSLVCIDEPEICLHPEWQEKYIQLLMSTFQNYRRCHFLIATHSPQIIAKLNDNCCYVMNMETGESVNASNFIKQSVDFQLARVFKSPGFKNEYLSRIALNVFAKVGKHKAFDSSDISNLTILEEFVDSLEKDDPVYDLILALRGMLITYG